MVFTVSCTGNSSAGEAFTKHCGSAIITAGSGPCHITQQYKFDLDQVWAHDYIFVKLAERFVRILCRLSAFILVAEEHAVPEPQRVRAVWASDACGSSHPARAELTCRVLFEQIAWAESISTGTALCVTHLWYCKIWQQKPPKYLIYCQTLACSHRLVQRNLNSSTSCYFPQNLLMLHTGMVFWPLYTF